MLFRSILLVLLLSACAPKTFTPCYQVFGPEEFAAESDLIAKEGKFGIEALEGKTFCDLTEEDFQSKSFCLDDGDKVQITLFLPGREDLVNNIQCLSERIGGFKVEGGEIELPGFEPVYVKGLSVKEARAKMKASFQEEVKGIDLFISVRDAGKGKVELLGMVQHDHIDIGGSTRLFEVLSKARIAPDANLYASYVLRDDAPLKVDLNRLIREGDMSQNVVMRSGDKIYIAHGLEKTALVMGEVRQPKPIPLVSGSTSLREAIALSGGIPFTGDERHIYVIRGDICQPQIYMLSMCQILQENNKRMLLIPGDVVYVSEKPITRWNHFLTQIQPTLTAVLSAQAIYDFTR
ncbi:MAG: hypothetical protein KDK62_07335 [Chlamydiia bacterium]|nr:hypothetical protein [Chlamydiia bacterium]